MSLSKITSYVGDVVRNVGTKKRDFSQSLSLDAIRKAERLDSINKEFRYYQAYKWGTPPTRDEYMSSLRNGVVNGVKSAKASADIFLSNSKKDDYAAEVRLFKMYDKAHKKLGKINNK